MRTSSVVCGVLGFCPDATPSEVPSQLGVVDMSQLPWLVMCIPGCSRRVRAGVDGESAFVNEIPTSKAETEATEVERSAAQVDGRVLGILMKLQCQLKRGPVR